MSLNSRDKTNPLHILNQAGTSLFSRHCSPFDTVSMSHPSSSLLAAASPLLGLACCPRLHLLLAAVLLWVATRLHISVPTSTSPTCLVCLICMCCAGGSHFALRFWCHKLRLFFVFCSLQLLEAFSGRWVLRSSCCAFTVPIWSYFRSSTCSSTFYVTWLR